MSRIKGKNTKPEILIRKYLFSKGFRFRLHDKNLPGKPDIVLKKYKTVIFVNGCFWHGHANCKYAVIPKTKTDWWTSKIEKTKKRDLINHKSLLQLNWNVVVIWECELKPEKLTKTIEGLTLQIGNY